MTNFLYGYCNNFRGGYGPEFTDRFFMPHMLSGLFMLAVLMIGLAIMWKVTKNAGGNKDALKQLDYRFASGEMTEQEYLQRKSALKSK